MAGKRTRFALRFEAPYGPNAISYRTQVEDRLRNRAEVELSQILDLVAPTVIDDPIEDAVQHARQTSRNHNRKQKKREQARHESYDDW